ncbi:hypothetical protein OAU50_04790 [Planctomycetota bacterium]|nr:hypothetical protein [Planctomycetota bacterium]
MNPEQFNLESLIDSMKDLRDVSLADQVKQALEGASLGLDEGAIDGLVNELESDIEDQIKRLEQISDILTSDERRAPEKMPHERRMEVAFQALCDIEEVDSLCEAFRRAREVLARIAEGGTAAVDIRLLFGNLPGAGGFSLGTDENGVPMVPSQIIEKLMSGDSIPFSDNDESVIDTSQVEPATELDDFEAMFDLEKTDGPKNRLPKDWNP